MRRLLVLAGSALLVGYVAFPILWLARLSVLPETLLIELPPAWLFTPTLSGYREVLTLHPFARYLQNSLVVAVSTSAGGRRDRSGCSSGEARQSAHCDGSAM